MKPADQDITTPNRPPHPFGSPDLRILRAWIEAEGAHPGDQEAVIAAVETAVRQAQEGPSQRSLGAYYYRVPAPIRPLLGQSDEGGLKQLLGRWEMREDIVIHARSRGREVNESTGWIAGEARLTEQEARTYWEHIRGASTTAIQRTLTVPNRRHDRRLWIAAQTVYNYRHQAKVKVLDAFGLAASAGLADADEEGAP